jgi:hypothetical protein
VTGPEEAVSMGSDPTPKLQAEKSGPIKAGPARRMSAREVATVITVMALFVGTGVGVILSSAEAASVAFVLGLIVAGIAFTIVSMRDRAVREEEK